MSQQEYVTVSLPKVLADEIDNALQHEAKNKGYSSRTDFVKDAIRELLEKLQEANPK